jgi:hypothetical protein
VLVRAPQQEQRLRSRPSPKIRNRIDPSAKATPLPLPRSSSPLMLRVRSVVPRWILADLLSSYRCGSSTAYRAGYGAIHGGRGAVGDTTDRRRLAAVAVRSLPQTAAPLSTSTSSVRSGGSEESTPAAAGVEQRLGRTSALTDDRVASVSSAGPVVGAVSGGGSANNAQLSSPRVWSARSAPASVSRSRAPVMAAPIAGDSAPPGGALPTSLSRLTRIRAMQSGTSGAASSPGATLKLGVQTVGVGSSLTRIKPLAQAGSAHSGAAPSNPASAPPPRSLSLFPNLADSDTFARMREQFARIRAEKERRRQEPPTADMRRAEAVRTAKPMTDFSLGDPVTMGQRVANIRRVHANKRRAAGQGVGAGSRLGVGTTGSSSLAAPLAKPARHVGRKVFLSRGRKTKGKPIPYRVVDIDDSMTPRKLAERMGVRARHVLGMLSEIGEAVSVRARARVCVCVCVHLGVFRVVRGSQF